MKNAHIAIVGTLALVACNDKAPIEVKAAPVSQAATACPNERACFDLARERKAAGDAATCARSRRATASSSVEPYRRLNGGLGERRGHRPAIDFRTADAEVEHAPAHGPQPSPEPSATRGVDLRHESDRLG
jgi:hypothetical protein